MQKTTTFRRRSGGCGKQGRGITGAGSVRIAAIIAATKAYVDAVAALVSGALVFKGAWDASGGTFPGAGAAQVGHFYKVSAAGTVDGKSFDVGDDIFAIVDDASAATYAGNWLKIEGSISLGEVQAAVGFAFGTAAALDAGASVGDLVQVQAGGKLPALDGSLLTDLAVAWANVTGQPTLGTAAAKDVGTSAGNVVEVEAGGKLPALDGSQLTNLSAGGLPTGYVALMPFSSPPDGWIKCNGALLSRSTYAALWAVANASGNIVSEASWSTNTGAFSTGDGASTFRIPDPRGIFVRGLDDGAGIDSGRTIGSYQADELKSHTHSYYTNFGAINVDTPAGVTATTPYPSTTGATGGTETRPKNTAWLACIKY